MLLDNPEKGTHRSFKYLEPCYAVACILDVFHENQRLDREGKSTVTAASDCWIDNDRLRRDVFDRACRFWCYRTGLNHTYFPLSVDAVARLYHRIRKRRAEEVENFEANIEEACRKLGPCRGE